MSSYDRYSASVFRNTNWPRYGAVATPTAARFGAPANEIELTALGEARYTAETSADREAVSDFVQPHPGDARATIQCYARVAAGGGWMIGLYEPSGRISKWLLKGDREAALHCDCHCEWSADCPRVVSRTPEEVAALIPADTVVPTAIPHAAHRPIVAEPANVVSATGISGRSLAPQTNVATTAVSAPSEIRAASIFAGRLRPAEATPAADQIPAIDHPQIAPGRPQEIDHIVAAPEIAIAVSNATIDDQHPTAGAKMASAVVAAPTVQRPASIFAGWLRSADTTAADDTITAADRVQLAPTQPMETGQYIAAPDASGMMATEPFAPISDESDLRADAGQGIATVGETPKATPLRRRSMWQRLWGGSEPLSTPITEELAPPEYGVSGLPDSGRMSAPGEPPIAIAERQPNMPPMIENAMPRETTLALPAPDTTPAVERETTPFLAFLGFGTSAAHQPAEVGNDQGVSSQAEIDAFVAAMRDLPDAAAPTVEEPADTSPSSGGLFSRLPGGR